MKDIDREIEFHVEMLTRKYVAEGLSEPEARARAEARLGRTERVRQECRAISEDLETAQMKRTSWWTSVRQDAGYAFRVLRRTPLFTATALLTLAVGIGSTTAIFSVVNAVLLRKLPYPNADRVMVIGSAYGESGVREASVAPEEFADLKQQTQAFDHVVAIRPQISALTGECGLGADCEPERVTAYAASPELFEMLGVSPERGRPFSIADGVTGAEKVVLLSEGLWRRRYGADPALIGRSISLGGLPRVVVGVMPASIRFPDEPIGFMKDRADIWIPVNWEQFKDGRGNQYLSVLASRRPTVSALQAEADLQRIGESFKARFPDRYAPPRRWRLDSSSLTDQMVGDIRPALVALFGAVACVLLIACANVTNLMLARGTARRRELAVRSALGANRARLVQQLLVETLVLTSAGTVLGIAVAAGAVQALLALNPGNIPRLDSARIDANVLMFAAALALVTGIVVGLIPALRQAKADPQSALGDGARGTDTTSPRRRLRGLLVMAEVTMAVVVLVGAALLIRSFVAMASVSTGVSGTNVAVARLSIPRATYNAPEKVFAFHQQMTARLAALPGVTRASAVYPLPMSGDGWGGSFSIVGRPELPGQEPHAEYAVALPGYFSTVGIPLVEGRDFASSDGAGAPQVAIVDTELARQFFPGQSAVGKRLAINGNVEKGPFQEIIGVVGHVRNKGARQLGEGQLYLAALQKSEVSLYFVAETSGAPAALMNPIRAAVREQDPRLPIATLSTLPDLLAKFTARERFNVLLFTIFGAVALAIAAIGLYGVLAFLVTQRSREIGIRLALGGKPGGVVRGVIAEGLFLTAGGLVAGLFGGWLLARSMKDLLFRVEPADPLTYMVIAAVMLLVAVAAAAAPARRATRVDPVEVLRS
jgi:putative ABC transport system permease protein